MTFLDCRRPGGKYAEHGSAEWTSLHGSIHCMRRAQAPVRPNPKEGNAGATERNMTDPNKQNVCVVGMGYWGKNLVRDFDKLGVLKAVCDSRPEVGALCREQYPDAVYSASYEVILNDASIRAVALATPALTHFDLARRALLAGKDVFVEKPMAVTTRDGEELIQTAEQNQRILMVGHILRFHPAVRKLTELVSSGALGKIQYLYSNRLNIGKIRTEENILWSFAPHDISVMLHLLDEMPDRVWCEGGNYLNRAVSDVTLSHFEFPSGVRAHIFVSWLHPFKEQRLVVVGSEKMAVFDDTAEHKLVLYPHKVEWKNRIPTAVKADAERVALESAQPLYLQCAHFVECIRKRQAPETDGAEGLRVLRVLEACQVSLTRRDGDAAPSAEATSRDGYVDPTACVDEGAQVGRGTKIWHFSHVMKGAQIGRNCVLGQNVHVADGVSIGNNVKIQNNVSVYAGAEIDDDVFLGPSCVLTNVTNPRSQVDRHGLYEKTWIRRGATIGANATVVCGVTIGRYAFVGAGAVVTRDVPDYALIIGHPAKRVGWMSRHGHRLVKADGSGALTCPESGFRYQEDGGALRCLDLDEDAPLPEGMRKGTKGYKEWKQ